jgi:outer membrane protein assembly factor BamB
VVDQFFASSWGDNACYLLGELALERGDHRLARESWQRILPPDYWLRVAGSRRDQRPPWLSYPDSDIPPADVLARLTLGAILEGSSDLARRNLDELRANFAESAGNLGGKNANYVQLLSGLLESMASWPLPAASDDWLTFAGSPQRDLAQRGNLDVGVVRWLQPLPKAPAADMSYGTRRIGEDLRSPLSYFPLVVGNLLLLNTQTEILALDVQTGKPVWGPDPVIFRDETLGIDRGSIRNALGTPRFTMTAFGSRLYVRLGNPVTSSQSEQPLPMDKGCLACIDLVRQGSLVWRIEPPDDKWAFEGSPLCDGDNVYVGMRRSDVRPQAHVACFDADNGKLKWRRMVSSAETPGQGQSNEITSNLLTLDGQRLYYNSNLGAVAALNTRRGQIEWLTIYPRAKAGDLSERATHFYRDLTPCVYDHGKLFVAPADAPPLWALDAATGLLYWKFEPVEDDSPIHLLGVAGGNLWASGDKLWWINVTTGKRAYWPEGAEPKSFGRGALVGNKVYWPTAERIHVFDQRSGQQARQPIELSARGAPTGPAATTPPLPVKQAIELSTRGVPVLEPLYGGNLLVAGGFLFIVTNDKVFALDQQSGMRLNANKPEPKQP